MTKRIALICATPRKLNTGMRFVDYSLRELMSVQGLLNEAQFYCFDTPPYLDDEEVEYKSVVDAGDMSAYDAIII